MYACRLLTRSKRTCHTIENKIMKMQMNKKEHNIIGLHKKTHATANWLSYIDGALHSHVRCRQYTGDSDTSVIAARLQ